MAPMLELRKVAIIATVVCAVSTFGLPAVFGQLPPADQRSDFETTIWPILQSHCMKCHNASEQKGDLRLDSRSGLEAGGHTGTDLIGSDHRSSGLFSRIRSKEKSFRMPPDGPALNETQLQAFRDWLDSGASWPTDAEPRQGTANMEELDAKSVGFFQRWLLQADPYLSQFQSIYRRVAILTLPAILLLIFVLVVERSKSKRRRSKKAGSDAPVRYRFFAGIRRVDYLLAIAALVGIGMWLYFRGELKESRGEIAKLDRRLNRLIASANELPAGPDSSDGPFLPRPNHPPRLGGTYYRGNDERDPALFNGGFYRTATMHVNLTDGNGRVWKIGDAPTENGLFVTLKIERAKRATTELFTDEIMASFFLSRRVALREPPRFNDSPVRFDEIDDQQSWIAHYPLNTIFQNGVSEATGTIYLYRGDADVKPLAGVYHFGIRYDLKLVDGRIADSSELWMGSLHHSSRVILPKPNHLFLNEWFDFRPIPEIEQTNTDDPDLLGIPEYVPARPPAK